MTELRAVSYVIYAAIGVVFGLVGAGVPMLLNQHQGFSWAGFSVGAGVTFFAIAVVRLFSRSAKPQLSITPLQRRLIGTGAVLFIATVFLFALTLHTQWLWPRKVMFATILGGMATVLAARLTTLFSPRPEA